jgi:hypothetical protein
LTYQFSNFYADYFEKNNILVTSAKYPNGNPFSFNLFWSNGDQNNYTSTKGIKEYSRIASVRSGNPNGFVASDVFAGSNTEGDIMRLTDGGSTTITKWCSLGSVGFFRGALYVDRSQGYAFGGKLIAVTTKGSIYAISYGATNCAGYTLLANTSASLDGALVVSADTSRWGGLAGKVITGNYAAGKLYAVGADKVLSEWTIGVGIGDLDYINANENWFGINSGLGKIIGVAASWWTQLDGSILITSKAVAKGTGKSVIMCLLIFKGLYELYWDFKSGLPNTRQLFASVNSTVAVNGSYWEHSTFGNVGVQEVLPPGYSLCLRMLNSANQ